jgi:hypothetical protein
MQPPTDPPATRQHWVSFDEARMLLRMSEGTLRREIKAGRVTAEKRRRSPDSPTDLREVYEVLVTDTPAPASQSESGQAPDTRQDTPAITERSLEIFSAVFKGNLEMIQQKDARILADAERIAGLMRQLGAAEAERDMLRTAHADCSNLSHAEASRFVQEATEQRPWWRRLW